MRVLLSIRPQYAEKIFSGFKRYEFRKVIHKNPEVKTIVVYATRPVCKVIGEFTVSGVHSDSPNRLWRKTKKASGITENFFKEYFAGREIGFAIEVGKTHLYAEPLELRDFLPHGYAPQSFVYLRASTEVSLEQTWASGAVELIKHADAHINLESAFDGRIAFISIDNAVETSIRVFLSLPSAKSGINVSRKDLQEAENSFPALLNLLWSRVAERLVGLDEADIEHYHRIRNKLYHDGTGLSVDQQHLRAYRQIAIVLLKNLFGVSFSAPAPAPTLERLVVLWNEIEKTLTRKAKAAGLEAGHTFYWEEAMREGVISMEEVTTLIELRMIRNKEVHSTSINRHKVEYGIELAEKLLKSFTSDSNKTMD